MILDCDVPVLFDELPTWHDQARCGDTSGELFFPIDNTRDDVLTTSIAIAMCGQCPVRTECLEYALDTDQRYGIWGGLTENQRGALQGRRHGAGTVASQRT